MLNPLLLYWADRGYVKIDDDGRGLKVTKIKWLPPFEESGRVDQKTYDCELTLFREMFTEHDVFYTLAASSKMNETYDAAIQECKKMSRSVVGKKGKNFFGSIHEISCGVPCVSDRRDHKPLYQNADRVYYDLSRDRLLLHQVFACPLLYTRTLYVGVGRRAAYSGAVYVPYGDAV